jgi:hypothetical protein
MRASESSSTRSGRKSVPTTRPARTRRRALGGAVAALAGAPLIAAGAFAASAAAQSGGTGASGPSGATGASGPLGSQLLRLSDLGKGWAVITTTGGGVGCLDRLLDTTGVRETTTGKAAFRHQSGSPQLFEQISTYTNETQAYTKVSTEVAHCHKLSGDPGGDPTTGTVRRIHFETFGKGTNSIAADARLDVAGLSVDEMFVIVSKNGEMLALTEAGIGSTVSRSQFEALASKAVKRLT